MSHMSDELGSKYAHEAIEYDLKGDRKRAILSYEIAIEFLIRTIHENPDSTQNAMYRNRIESYEERIQYMQN